MQLYAVLDVIFMSHLGTPSLRFLLNLLYASLCSYMRNMQLYALYAEDMCVLNAVINFILTHLKCSHMQLYALYACLI